MKDSKESIIKKVQSDLNTHEVQILYTRIHRDSSGLPKFERHNFQVNSKQYFYPASTVKFPVAILALQKIRKLQSQGFPITADTPFTVLFSENLIVKTDSTHPKNKLTIAHLIKKIFLVSDNAAYNYLFDFIGSDDANNAIHNIGITNFNLSHKFSDADNKNSTPRFIFFNQNGDTLYNQAPIISNQKIKNTNLSGVLKGKGYVKDGTVIEEPIDFSEKNYASIIALHKILERIIFPKVFSKKEQFTIEPEDYFFLRYWMSRIPNEVAIPFYDRETFFDSYGKFFIYGDKKGEMTNNIRIYNKVGLAYGTATDVAYVKDSNGVEFFLTATILTNKNEIFNDNTYEYDQLGIPFLAALGREIYQFEKNKNSVK
ncbi:class A beta-lactamase-related serine hydrolase [Flavobacteriaceae bacterium]|nr:class A beta-lactamase-related serine hydrolase [Flavobacteriaceae bacterium]